MKQDGLKEFQAEAMVSSRNHSKFRVVGASRKTGGKLGSPVIHRQKFGSLSSGQAETDNGMSTL